jgi:hypothetical protein
MESIYESLFSSGRLFSEQLARMMLPEVPEDGPWMILVGSDRNLWASDPVRMKACFPEQDRLLSFCDRIDDGQDPVLIPIEKGCLLGTELYTERINAGYLFVVLPGYTPQTAQVNMDLIELLFSQIRLICSLLEKNNQLHQLQLNHMSRTSSVLSGHSS